MTQENRPSPQFKPLYEQVKELIIERIVGGVWKPGEVLPSEFQLADMLNVSQGTVRKALNTLTEENVVFRRQGVGTFVSKHTLQEMLFHFFRFKHHLGESADLPTADIIDLQIMGAEPKVALALNLASDDKVIRLHRVRIINGDPCIRELIYLPHHYFGDLHLEAALPHALYNFYQNTFNITIHNAVDSITADLSNATDAKLLNIEVGQPLLEVARVATALDGRLVEYSISRAHSKNLHYEVKIT
ncbi:GntR family transcriptional regulator [Marinomonas sp. 15G1-11]|uniref:GntR family transcriptional regulator n=1 Tax=Marinomonas phaeophyticola TaxID=3004091 RepID=A0ABT4JXY3_9GAMM|nr:GntR family transcriptional regulator [Marinomonas sp. 15G1-11]MCZ2722643.1 GntR family transcriptional regulator [Marinomonas sp. 15G1-11]